MPPRSSVGAARRRCIVYAPLLTGCTTILYEGPTTGGSETGWPIAANCLGLEALPVKHGSPTKAVPGYDVRIRDDQVASTIDDPAILDGISTALD